MPSRSTLCLSLLSRRIVDGNSSSDNLHVGLELFVALIHRTTFILEFLVDRPDVLGVIVCILQTVTVEILNQIVLASLVPLAISLL